MKSIVAWSLILVFLLQSGMKLTIVAYYQINKDYIASTLCENKSKPQVHCNGKCYLNKQLKAEEKREQKSSLLSKSLENLHLFHWEIPALITQGQLLRNIFFNSFYLLRVYISSLSCIFQPPQ